MTHSLPGHILHSISASAEDPASPARVGNNDAITCQRLLEIRLRIAGGFYERRGVRLAVAERLIRSGKILPAAR